MSISFEEMRDMIKGLRMSGFSFVEPEALDWINERIKHLPSSEELPFIYKCDRKIEKLRAEVGGIMKNIEYYGSKNQEYSDRYKSKTGLPPRFKTLKWKKAMKKTRLKKVSQEVGQNIPVQYKNLVQDAEILNEVVSEVNTLKSEMEKLRDSLENLNISNMKAEIEAKFSQIQSQVDAFSNVDLSGMKSASTYANSLVKLSSGLSIETKRYIFDIINLSNNLEEIKNGEISKKLISYANNLNSLKIKEANKDFFDAGCLLNRSGLNKEAKVISKSHENIIKKAGFRDKVKNFFGKGDEVRHRTDNPSDFSAQKHLSVLNESLTNLKGWMAKFKEQIDSIDSVSESFSDEQKGQFKLVIQSFEQLNNTIENYFSGNLEEGGEGGEDDKTEVPSDQEEEQAKQESKSELEIKTDDFIKKYTAGGDFKYEFDFSDFVRDLNQLLKLHESFLIRSSESNSYFKKISYDIDLKSVYKDNKPLFEGFQKFLKDENFLNLIYKNYDKVNRADLWNKLKELQTLINNEYKRSLNKPPEGLEDAINMVTNPNGQYPTQGSIDDLIKKLNEIKININKSSFNLSGRLRKTSQEFQNDLARRNLPENPYEEVDASILDLIKDPKNLNINNIDKAISLLKRVKETQTGANKEERELTNRYKENFGYFIKEKIMPNLKVVKNNYPNNWLNVINYELQKFDYLNRFLTKKINEFSNSLIQNPYGKKLDLGNKEEELNEINLYCEEFKRISNIDLLSNSNFEQQIQNLESSQNKSAKSVSFNFKKYYANSLSLRKV